MLKAGSTYDEVRDRFRWEVPEHYNIGTDVCDRWAEADPDRLALIEARADGSAREVSFRELRGLSNRFANLLRSHGIGPGERVGILLPQAVETAVAHIGTYKAGSIAIPLFGLFGPEALAFRLADSGAKAVVTDAAGAAKLATIRDEVPALRVVFSVDGAGDGALGLAAEMGGEPDSFTPVRTRADDPALIVYTSGTTGQPKGALHAHRVLLGHLPGVEMSHDLLPQPGDRLWTPADWAWVGGLIDVLLPGLHHGVTVVARRFEKFSAEAAFQLMQDFRIRNTFLPPTALKLMRALPDAERRYRLDLRTVASGGETLGTELLDWGRRVLGVTINEFYGQTECNMVVSSAGSLMEARPGWMGRAVPGHEVAIVDEDGTVLGPGELGSVAVRAPNPVMFLKYWNNEGATSAKFRGDWLVTGDLGERDEDGWLRFVGRDDDVITSSGYRIGPGEIEDCLLRHPAIGMAGVVGKPDPERTEIVMAFIVLKDGFAPSPALAREIQEHVKSRLAAHEYPREVEFVEDLPMTTTGKVIRRALRDRASAPKG
ncbi:acyl-CoA synthetase [Enterovirga rhinocerotis]|uniref:Acetyl-CoA synthetase n=1 Tax=Enterovirga rhinocerotis TaxID=1339210 RepID=A0A4R7C9Z5_9HYPH|nr:acyl-CoA synthetase [Enterovirga rhinocerotis]TDR94882.1 acetyl-CoA synthetase [Enterovirga rhinocerotis]